jgi:hypothetical protein
MLGLLAYLSLNRPFVDMLCYIIQFDCRSAVVLCSNSAYSATCYTFSHFKDVAVINQTTVVRNDSANGMFKFEVF